MSLPFVPAQESIRNSYTGEVVGSVPIGDAAAMERAIVAAERAYRDLRGWPRFERKALLLRIAAGLVERKAEFVDLMIAESGKPRIYSEAEVDRAAMTFTLAAEELSRRSGEILPLDLSAATVGYTALVKRMPIGVIGAIAPFNFPLNLVAHKLAPALAIGNTVILKPPPQAPLTAFKLAELTYDAGLPRDALTVIHCPVEVAERLATDERIAMLSFTGSSIVGWHLKSIAGKKRVALELGGNAAAVVCADADIAWAAKRCALGAFAQAGQVCIKVQRLLVDQAIYPQFQEALLGQTRALGVGDPADPKTVVGPIIDARSVERIMDWIGEAVAGGAKVLHGGTRSGPIIQPTVLSQTQTTMRVECEEIFGPVVTVAPFENFDQAIARVNDSRYGLQAGVFTYDVRTIARAFEEFEVGGVIANDYPTLRIDNYPYGGIKDSGFGREGVRYAMDEMSELRTLVINYR